jgi:hypothetical protein
MSLAGPSIAAELLFTTTGWPGLIAGEKIVLRKTMKAADLLAKLPGAVKDGSSVGSV